MTIDDEDDLRSDIAAAKALMRLTSGGGRERAGPSSSTPSA
ncbi:hypothetical protein [Jiangella ureilytica]|nr:hypothetical protein [Jiangella ureilytica]